jgi:hypothetical protein
VPLAPSTNMEVYQRTPVDRHRQLRVGTGEEEAATIVAGGRTEPSRLGHVRGYGHWAHRRELLGEAQWLSRCGIQLHAFERYRADDREHEYHLSPAAFALQLTASANVTRRTDEDKRGRLKRRRVLVRPVPRVTVVRRRRGRDQKQDVSEWT